MAEKGVEEQVLAMERLLFKVEILLNEMNATEKWCLT